MITKEEFSSTAFSTIGDYPTLESLYKAKDPRLFQHIDAISMMLSMFSAQVEVSQAEPFDKTKNSTVLADAAMRGILPKATPSSLILGFLNEAKMNFEVSAGRVLLDSSGRYLRADSSLKVEAGQTGQISATQLYAVEEKHTVLESRPFYEIPIKFRNEESKLCGVKVFDSLGVEYAYTDRYAAAVNDQKIYHIEVDERQNFYIRFGYKDIVGYQPAVGDVFTITCFYTTGKIENYSVGDVVTLAQNHSVADAFVKITIDSVKNVGIDPLKISLIRELAKYPSIYNKNAVYLGEFDLLIRGILGDSIDFLSIWSEPLEEMVRGHNVKNMNCLFVAVVESADNSTVINLSSEKTTEIQVLTQIQHNIKNLIFDADDSYHIKFYTPLKNEIQIRVEANISTAFDIKVVEKQIHDVILGNFGRKSITMSRGRSKVRHKSLNELLKKNVPALSVGTADYKITIESNPVKEAFPEVWNFVTPDSLTIEVFNSNVTTESWGVGF